MQALVMTEFDAAMTVIEVDPPPCPADGVVIAVRATGVCRSDWHAWKGHATEVRLPHVPGHEFAGTVHTVGPDVTGWHVGDRVTVPFVVACGRCEPCRLGQHQVCADQRQPGFTQWGSFAELVAVQRADVNLVRLPPEMDFATAAGLGCRFSTAYHALTAQAQISADEWVAVHGCGGVGLSAVMIAAALGARVVAVDVATEALVAARHMGAQATVDAQELDARQVVARIREITGGGAHVSIDALGSVATCVNSIRGLRIRGTHVQVGLMVGPASRPPIPMDRVVAYELRIVGSHGMAAHDFRPMLDLVAGGAVRPQDLIRRRITLAEAGPVLQAMDSERGFGGISVVEMPPTP